MLNSQIPTNSLNFLVCVESNRAELVWDKNGVQVTSLPPGDENGVIELSVQSDVRKHITLIVENKGTENIRLKDITLLWSVNFFDYSGISQIGLDKGNLVPGNFLINLFVVFSLPNLVRSLDYEKSFFRPVGRARLHQKKTRGKMAAWKPWVEKPAKLALSLPGFRAANFFLAVFFRVIHHGLSEIGTSRSLFAHFQSSIFQVYIGPPTFLST